MEAKTGRPGQRKKSIEEVVGYAVSHRIRVHILIVLNEGTYTAAQIAQIIGEPLNNVSNHIRELVDAGSIELAKTEPKGNVLQHFYRAVEMPFYSQEEAEAMTPEQRQVTAGLVVQSASAEVMAALWAGKLADPRTCLAWDWFNVDEQGREDIEAEQKRSWERIQEIEAEATNRRAESGEEAQSMLVTLFGYERARKAHKFPPS
ncbi:MAG: winged helix-turn-helix domain-containing protein [Solirubrobacterales bacterium]